MQFAPDNMVFLKTPASWKRKQFTKDENKLKKLKKFLLEK